MFLKCKILRKTTPHTIVLKITAILLRLELVELMQTAECICFPEKEPNVKN